MASDSNSSKDDLEFTSLLSLSNDDNNINNSPSKITNNNSNSSAISETNLLRNDITNDYHLRSPLFIQQHRRRSKTYSGETFHQITNNYGETGDLNNTSNNANSNKTNSTLATPTSNLKTQNENIKKRSLINRFEFERFHFFRRFFNSFCFEI
jgi:hypothetical protein